MKNERTSLFLMANLGSEVSKIFSAINKNNSPLLNDAFKRAETILHKIKDLPETKNNKELDILHDVIKDICQREGRYDIKQEHLESYFTPFALRLLNN
jgi:hypothetical protein